MRGTMPAQTRSAVQAITQFATDGAAGPHCLAEHSGICFAVSVAWLVWARTANDGAGLRADEPAVLYCLRLGQVGRPLWQMANQGTYLVVTGLALRLARCCAGSATVAPQVREDIVSDRFLGDRGAERRRVSSANQIVENYHFYCF